MKKTMNSTATKYLDVKQRIEASIRDGRFVSKLPGERQMAREFGVSYMTLRKAVECLVRDGLVYRVPQMGTFVNRFDRPVADTEVLLRQLEQENRDLRQANEVLRRIATYFADTEQRRHLG